jgi:16S rRNA (cytidine1402-2'-O)-methyltransferase
MSAPNGRASIPGTLYIVATPIGNLGDLTLRALEILKQVSRIACEDTRHTAKLLNHFGVVTPTVSYHEHNERERAVELVAALSAGESIALVTDAGTPLVSDPGYRLVERATAEQIPVVPLPGASAALAALMGSGLATDEFRFCGFLPPRTGARRTRLQELAKESCTLVFFEAPHRLLETLADLEAELGDRPAVVARELTKLHEEFLRGTLSHIQQGLAGQNPRGEVTIVIGKALPGDVTWTPEQLQQEVERREAAGAARMDAIKETARHSGVPKREVYQAIEAGKQGEVFSEKPGGKRSGR